ncbi:HD-GYP domain-containing protein [Teredinibacter purpureus]|uniref:HD-GYP domain-containing protein n=1 Tax=Teredinibacter purpureus TaxID=2731756 RepID=UPI0005F7E19D|nr:HD domain-containing phosphohydrolase [Teredinibacter purpureus]
MTDNKTSFNDHYLQHLIALAERYPMVVSFDIHCSSREIPYTAGTPIEGHQLQTLVGRTLIQPIGMNISIPATFNAQELERKITDYFLRDPVLHELYQLVDLTAIQRMAAERLCEQESLAQYLWVMSRRLPKHFERALFCAWTAAALGVRRNKSTEQILESFMAGIVHDIGLLLIPEFALNEHQDLSAADWLQMMRHPAIGYELLSFLPNVPVQVARAVLEHHEEMDGSGYPAHKIAKQLSPLGQLVHLLDGIHAIYVKYFQSRGRTLHDLIPIIQMNQLSRPGFAAADLVLLLRNCTASESCSIPEELMPVFILQVRERHQYINRFVEQAEIFVEQNQMSVANARIYSLSCLLEHICIAMKQSGLINDAYMRWLDQVESEHLKHAYREVEDVFLMMQEILFHIQRFMLRLGELVEEDETTVTELTPIWAPAKTIALIEGRDNAVERKTSNKESLVNFGKQSTPTIPAELHELWLTQVRQIKQL